MKITADKLAQLFHEAYEELAPSFDYTTRPDSAKPWDSVPQKNKSLMIATAAVVLSRIPRHEVNVTKPVITRIRYEVHDSGGALSIDTEWNNKKLPLGGILTHRGNGTMFNTREEAAKAIDRTDQFAQENDMGAYWRRAAHRIVEVRD